MFRYENAKHGPHGYFVIFFAVMLTTVDALAALTRAFRYLASVRRKEISFTLWGFWRFVILDKDHDALDNGSTKYAHEYAGLVTEHEDFEMDVHELKAAGNIDHVDLGSVDSGLTSPNSEDRTTRWANDIHTAHRQHRERGSTWRSSVASDGTLFNAQPTRRGSHHSDETLHELPSHVPEVKAPLMRRIGRGLFATAERVLVFMGYMQFISGLVTYTGVCRDSYVNGCLAHLIST